MPYRDLLRRPRLSVISAEPDRDLDRMAQRIAPSVRIGGPAELAALFERLVAASREVEAIAPKTLDLFGHSSASTSQLRLGGWVIDGDDPAVTAVFRELADRGALARLGVHAVRLLGCRTADTEPGRRTICTLADILGVEVYGTRHLLHDAHHDEHGFRDVWRFLLVCASDLRRAATPPAVRPEVPRWPRVLDLDALPARPLAPRAPPWPRRIATPDAVHRILLLIRRDAGAPMPGLVTAPICELALPSVDPRAFHVAEVLLDGAFLRFYPGGSAGSGVVYPVDDAHALRRIVEALPAAGVSR